MGLVEVSGLAAGPYLMPSPITCHPCYYYRTLVWEYRQEGRNKKWVKIAGECCHLPFFLDDNTGRVLIDPRGADFDLHRDFHQEFCDGFFTTKEPAPPNVREFLMQHGISTRNKIRVEEFCIKPKNALFILGTLSENDALEVTDTPVVEPEDYGNPASTFLFSSTSLPGIAISVGTTLFKVAAAGSNYTSQSVAPLPSVVRPAKTQDPAQLQKITDALLRAGIANPAAWRAAGVAPALGVVTPSAGWSDPNPGVRPPVVIRKGQNDSTFLISWHSRDAVASKMGWKCAGMIWGGGALTVVALYVLAMLLQWH